MSSKITSYKKNEEKLFFKYILYSESYSSKLFQRESGVDLLSRPWFFMFICH